MKKAKKLIDTYGRKFGGIILDSEGRGVFLFKVLNSALGTVSTVMTIVNIITGFRTLMWSTLIFAACCFLNVALAYGGTKCLSVAKFLFRIEIVVLFTFFIINGSPEGFSAFWTPLLPACGLMIFGLAEGLALDTVMLIIAIFLCWTPAGRSLLQYDYTKSFLLRFPLLYIGYMSVGVLLGFILTHTQQAYYNLSNHDKLTGALNRTGFSEAMNASGTNYETIGFMIMDLDKFKNVNDTYGHFVGDEVLRYALDKIRHQCPDCPVCRWGGEEFAVFVRNGNRTKNLADGIVKALNESDCVTRDGIRIHQTISVGAVETRRENFNQDILALEADKCLYEAKDTGRNRAVYKLI